MTAVIAALLALIAWKPLARLTVMALLALLLMKAAGPGIGLVLFMVAAAFILAPRR